MKYNTFPRVLQIAACIHDCYRRLGFAGSDIFMEVAHTTDPEVSAGEIGIFMTLRAQGLEFLYTCGGWPESKASEIAPAWTRMCDAITSHEMPPAEHRRMYDQHISQDRFTTLALLMKRKGFRLPITEN